MDTETLIWIIVAIVVALLLLGLAAVLMRRKKERRQAQATELRQDAVARTPRLDEADVQAHEARAEAERARLEAERAQAKAQEAEEARTVEAAEYEDRLREADRLDPGVDTKSGDYDPDVNYPTGGGSAPPKPPPSPGTHRGS